MDYKGLCLGCMRNKGNAVECPHCGYVEGTPQVLPYLEPGTVLLDKYIVGKRIHTNGEGVTYIGFNMLNNKRVTIREYLPKTLCTREKGSDNVIISQGNKLVYQDYLQDFMEIARAEAKLTNLPCIIPVIEMFDGNNTAYVVSEYVEGKPLSDIVKKARRLTWEEARSLFLPLISTMISAHSIGLVHFGLSPSNIMMTRDGTLKILGFGSPDAHLAEMELAPEFYDGYSAIEQYSLEGKKGKWTDVYGLSAVILYALTGKNLPGAVSRAYDQRLNIPADVAKNIPTYVVTALAGGLQVKPENRIHSMEELKEQISNPVARQTEATNSVISAASAGYVEYDDNRDDEDDSSAAAVGRKSNSDDDDDISPYKYGIIAGLVGFVVLGVIALLLIRFVVLPLLEDDSTVSGADLYVSSTASEDTSSEVKVLYEVPDLTGRLWSEVNGNSKYSNFDVRLTSEEYSDTVEEGVIISQTVEAGSAVAQNTPIGVTVSLGSKMREVPDIIGMTVSEASAALEAVGLSLGDQAEEYSSSYEMGCIIRLNGTTVGSKIQVGSMINVVVSLGEQ